MIQVIHRAFNILELLARQPERIFSLTDISQTLKLNPSTCANILKTMADRHYVDRVGDRKGYMLGPMAYQLTGNDSFKRDLVAAAEGPMYRLTEQLNETSVLGVIRGTKRITIYDVASTQALHVRSSQERSVYETATGRLLLSFYGPAEREAFIQQAGLPEPKVWPEIESREYLEQALDKIRRDELAMTKSASHIVGLAVPVRRKENVIASLSVFLPDSRFNAVRKKEIVTALRRSAAEIEENLRLQAAAISEAQLANATR